MTWYELHLSVATLGATWGGDQRGAGVRAERPAGMLLADMQTRHDAAVEVWGSGTRKVFFGGRMRLADRLPLGKAGSGKSPTTSSEYKCAFSPWENL